MTKDRHLKPSDLYQLAEGDAELAERIVFHFLEACQECGDEWTKLGPNLQPVQLMRLGEARLSLPLPLPHVDELSGSENTLNDLREEVARRRYLYRRASKQLSELRTSTPSGRVSKIVGARKRFRSRQLAELLIDEARACAASEPKEAAAYAALVPHVLRWASRQRHRSWAEILLARAEAHQANALRIAGQLPAAASMFRALSPRAADLPDVDACAEIMSLEASLRIDQRRFEEADRLLVGAALRFDYVGNRSALVKTRIQHAHLLQSQGYPDKVLERLNTEIDVAEEMDPYLVACVVTAKVNAHCDLRMFLEGRSLLDQHLDVFEAADAPHLAAALRGLEGRLALGFEDYLGAEEHFRTAADILSEVGRTFDAALASLYLAEALLAQGRTTELKRLTVRLISEFHSREIEGEALKAVRLLGQAAAQERLTIGLIAKLRRSLAAEALYL